MADKKYSDAEVQEALKLLEAVKARKAKEKAKMDELKKDPEWIKKQKLLSAKTTVKNSLLMKKATAAGITVSDAEINAELKKRGLI